MEHPGSSIAHNEVDVAVAHRAWARGKARWPQIDLSRAALAEFVARQGGGIDPRADDPREAHGEELFLACACATGEPRALAIFTSQFGDEVRAVLRRLRSQSSVLPDVEQKIWIRLLVGQAPSRPKISEYGGRGSLKGWIRTVAVRVALNERRVHREEPLEQALMHALTSPEADLEAQYLKRLYRKEFESAFLASLSALSPRARTILTQRYLDELNIDQLAALYRVHRATAARELARARATVMAETRRCLSKRLQLSSLGVDSVLRLIQSRVDGTLFSRNAEKN